MNDYEYYYNSTYVEDHDHLSYNDDNISSYNYHSSNLQNQRFLAPSGDAPTVDYAVISVVVITLTLVLAIEVLRHQLDVAARYVNQKRAVCQVLRIATSCL